MLFSHVLVIAGDVILFVSDGVYDNVDPEHVGLSPAQVFDLSSPFSQINDWEHVPMLDALAKKETFKIEKLTSLYAIHLSPDTAVPSLTRLSRLSVSTCKGAPDAMVTALLTHAHTLTKKTREFMEAHPNDSEPKDFLAFPGKMDHATCIAFRVKYDAPFPSCRLLKLISECH